MNKKTTPETFQHEIVRRPNQTIAVNPKAGKITAVMRRSFIAMLYFSQKDGHQEIYRRSLKDLAAAAQFTSRNTAELKDHLREMQGTQVEWNDVSEDENRWTVSGMVSQIDVIEKKGGATYIEWALPPRVRNELLNPESYTSLALQIYTSLRSGASIALYGICSRYKTNPSRVTNRDHWEWWRPRLTGNPEPEANNEYKYFKRDVIKPAVIEINAISDIEIELIEFKNGKRVEEIQFRVMHKASVLEAPLPAIPDIDGELLEQILRLGIPQKEARELCAKHDAAFLLRTIALTEQRAGAPGITELGSKVAWFRAAIKGRYVDTTPVDKPQKAAVAQIETLEAKKERIHGLFQADRVKTAYEAYKELDAEAQAVEREAFRQATTVGHFKTEIRQHGLKSAAARTAFCEWYAMKLWGEPTEQDLLNFMIRTSDMMPAA